MRQQTCSTTPNDEKSYSVIFNCKYSSDHSGTNPTTNTIASDTAEDKEFYLFFYPNANSVNHSITIKNIQLVQVD